MSEELKDILGNGTPGKLSEEKLMAYLEGKLSAEEQHEVEEFLAQESFEAEAIEGLKDMPPADARHSVDRLNHDLRKQLLSRRTKHRRQIKDNPWALLAVALTLLFIILAYFVIRLILK
jgi:anti-sigma factor RsiW